MRCCSCAHHLANSSSCALSSAALACAAASSAWISAKLLGARTRLRSAAARSSCCWIARRERPCVALLTVGGEAGEKLGVLHAGPLPDLLGWAEAAAAEGDILTGLMRRDVEGELAVGLGVGRGVEGGGRARDELDGLDRAGPAIPELDGEDCCACTDESEVRGACTAAHGEPPFRTGVGPSWGDEPGCIAGVPGVLRGVRRAAVSAIIFLRSTFSCCTVRLFHTGALLLPAGRVRGVIGLPEVLGRAGVEGVEGLGSSSSMVKISSLVLERGLRSGVAPGERGTICGLRSG